MSELESDQIHATITKLVAEAGKLQAEQNKLQAEQLKLTAEGLKHQAEQAKLNVEGSKLERERVFYPFVVGAGFASAFIAGATLILKMIS